MTITVSRPVAMANQIAELIGKPAKLVPPELYSFDPEKVKPRYSFKNRGGDFIDLLEALGFDLAKFSDAYGATGRDDDDEPATVELTCGDYYVIVTKDHIYLDDHAYYLEFLQQALQHYDCRCEWKAVKPLARMVKRFCMELKKSRYHYHYNADIILRAIEDKSAFYFCRYLQQMFFTLWT